MAVEVPRALRTWFVIHFLLDLAFAVPLIVAPVFTLTLFGWTTIDPFTTRLVGAALVGIGVESLLGRHAPVASYHTMLRLKILWSVTANVGIAWSILEGLHAWGAFVVQGIFLAFSVLWIYWAARLRRMERA